MKREDVCVLIDTENTRLRVLDILQKANEPISSGSKIFKEFQSIGELCFCQNQWVMFTINSSKKTYIALDQLNQILNPNSAVTEVILSVEELRLQAERLGFELTEKKREIKVGDFGVFWDLEDEDAGLMVSYGFLMNLFGNKFKDGFHSTSWEAFRHLTEEEKAKIQENW
jgi:hypothetical protein